jgi:hypothetical protein
MVPEKDLEELVVRYLVQIRHDEREEIGQFQELSTLREAIVLAASGRDVRGNHFNHQKRILKSVDSAATASLLSIEEGMSQAASFDELLWQVQSVLRDVRGVGELYEYDVAFRIGARLGLMPAAVYPHADVREGVKALDFSGRERLIEMDRFPRPLQTLSPWELESFLCIAASELKRLNQANSASSSTSRAR